MPRTWILFGAGLPVLLAAVQHWLGESTLPTTLLLYLPQHQWALAPLAVTLACLWTGQRFGVLLGLASLLSWLILLMGWIPRPAPTFPRFAAPGTIRVLTYNVHMGLPKVRRIAADLADSHPDIVFLQETTGPRGELDKDPLPAIARAFPGWEVARAGEVAIISRFPIEVQRLWPLPPPSRRTMLECVIRTPQGPLTVFSVHVSTAARPRPDLAMAPANKHLRRIIGIGDSAATRMKQLPAILGPLRNASGNWVMAGDFNTPPRGLFYRALSAQGVDTFRRAGGGMGFSYPAGRPLMRIDYIFASSQITVLRSKTAGRGGSDHRMVLADIVLPDTVAAR